MPRMRKDCPICVKRNLVKLANHLADIHQISAVKKKDYLSGAKYPAKPEDMSSQKRMRNEFDDEILTVSNKDIFSSLDDDKSSEETDDAGDEGKSYEKTNDSDEQVSPWRALIDEATAELYAKHIELVQSFENDRFSEINTKKQAFAAFLSDI